MSRQNLDEDIFQQGLSAHINAIKTGQLSVVSTIRHCLRRISILDRQLMAFEHLAADEALSIAAAMDEALGRGQDPGPLAGVPIGVKDIYTVEGMPTTNGSLHPNEHLNGPEGRVVRDLKAAGCIVLGKTRTVEFALGASGINSARGTPVNPWDSVTHRIPGGSSSGSGVAVAAGLCGFALGSDTGGSVRNPACLNGLAGHKTTIGRWPTEGIFPLSSTFDTAGPLCRSAADAALLHTVITGENVSPPVALDTLRLGRPVDYFFDELDDAVRDNFELAVKQLQNAGVAIVEFELPEAHERDHLFPLIVPSELISQLTAAGFAAARTDMDSVTESRAAKGLEVLAADYLQAQKRLTELQVIGAGKMSGLDGWLMPTCQFTPMPIASVQDGTLHDRALLASHNTMPVNLFGMTALTIPTAHLAPHNSTPSLPTGLQLVARANEDAHLLSMGIAVEQLIGTGNSPDVSGFIA